MAELSLNDQLTPLEIAKRFGDKQTIFIYEALSQTNELLLDAVIGEASDGTVNRTTQRVTLPHGTRRIYGQPIASEASQTRQIEDGIEMIEAYSDIEADMADHSPNKKALIDSEDRAFLEGIGETQIEDLLYAKREDGLEFIDGLYVRLPEKIDNQNVFGVETSGSNFASILLVKWSEDKAKLIYPRGISGLGVSAEWRGKQDVAVMKKDGTLGTLPMYRTFYKTHFGVTVRHGQAVKRIANINPLTSDPAKIMVKLIAARNKLARGGGTVVAYMNADVKTLLDTYTQVTNQRQLVTKDDPWGRQMTSFGEIRFRQIDKMLSTESLVPAV
jgi:hypothetical protein